MWASFNWAMQVDLDTALAQQEKLTESLGARQFVAKTAALGKAIDRGSAAALRRAQFSHSGTILASECRLLLCRATPMQPS